MSQGEATGQGWSVTPRAAARSLTAARIEPAHLAVLVLWLVCVPLAAHLAFSSLGYNPTDDGQMLAYARDILLGRVPHRDVGSFHMAGTYFLWAPVVALGGDYVFWIARGIVWFEHALIAWLWVLILGRMLHLSLRPAERFALAGIAFIYDVHTFPIMPWHTTDGLLFLSLGLALATRDSGRSKVGGYALVGMAYLFRQNLVVMVPLTLLVMGDWRRWRNWLAAIAPGLLYGTYLLIMGALGPALEQVTYEKGVGSLGVLTYLGQGLGVWPGVGLGLGLMALRYGGFGPRGTTAWRLRIALAWVAAAAVILVCARHLATGDFVWAPSFFLFGLVAGAAAYALLAGPSTRGIGRAGVLVLAIGWSISLSIGYNTPAEATGIMLVLLLCALRGPVPLFAFGSLFGLARSAGAALVVVAAALAFVSAREQHIYREQTAGALTYRLDGIFPGGALLRTDRNTYDYLADLKHAIARLGGKPYAILPDCPGCWVQSAQPDWLPIPWPAVIEIDPPSITQHIIQALDAHRGRAVIFISRYNTAQLATGNIPVPLISNPITWYVDQHFRRIGETRYFFLYD